MEPTMSPSSQKEYQEKTRELFCPHCLYYMTYSKYPAPKCEHCRSTLITVLRSIMTGERITGNDV